MWSFGRGFVRSTVVRPEFHPALHLQFVRLLVRSIHRVAEQNRRNLFRRTRCGERIAGKQSRPQVGCG